jgi:hypothetical protein
VVEPGTALHSKLSSGACSMLIDVFRVLSCQPMKGVYKASFMSCRLSVKCGLPPLTQGLSSPLVRNPEAPEGHILR